jgi:hypothetical protein
MLPGGGSGVVISCYPKPFLLYSANTLLNKAMRKIARIALALAIAISLSAVMPALLMGKPEMTSLSIGIFYNFFMIAFFGWFIYIPFALLHARLLKGYPKRDLLTSTVIGGLLASTIVVLLTSSFTPAEIELGQIGESQFFTILTYGSGGSLYGLLYQGWVVKE